MDIREDNINHMLHNPFMQYNHFKIGHFERDYGEVYLDLVPESMNGYGAVHGGAFFTMADCCAGLTARTDGRYYVTENASVNFLRNVKSGRVTAYGKIVHRGRRIVVVAVDIKDETGRLLFNSSFTMYCITEDQDKAAAVAAPKNTVL